MEKTELKRSDLMAAIFFVFVVFCFLRVICILPKFNKVEKYSYAYVRSMEKIGIETDRYDKDIVFNRIIPYPVFVFLNPFVWTEKQISFDDDLLSEARLSFELEIRKENTEKELAKRTFNERYSSCQKENK
jgi:hypothetical protein